MRVLVCGGRDFDNYEELAAALRKVDNARRITLLIEGGASGADTLARRWARQKGIPVDTYRADWNRWGTKMAGEARNQRMLDEGKPDLVVAFPGDTGTADMIGRAQRAGVPVEQPHIEKRDR